MIGWHRWLNGHDCENYHVIQQFHLVRKFAVNGDRRPLLFLLFLVFACRYAVVSAALLKSLCFLHWVTLTPFSKINWPYWCICFWTLHVCPCVLMLTLYYIGYCKFVQILFVRLFQNCFDYSRSLIILYILKNQPIALYRDVTEILIRIILKYTEWLYIKIWYFNHSVFQTMNTVHFSTYLDRLKFISSMVRSFCI